MGLNMGLNGVLSAILFILFILLFIVFVYIICFRFYSRTAIQVAVFELILFGLMCIKLMCSGIVQKYITTNAEYTIEEQQHKIKEINEKQVILDDGKKYKYKFEYDERAESPYAKIADCQYSKTAKSWFGESLKDQIVIIYTCIIVNN